MDKTIHSEILGHLLRQTKKVVFSYDVEATSFTYLNEAFYYVWETSQESVLANPDLILQTIHPDDQAYLLEAYNELLQGIEKHNVEFRIKLADDREKWLLLHPQLIHDSEGKRHIAGFAEDNTVVRQTLFDLHRHGAKKNSILEILSHDLAGPLANIQIMADLLASYTKKYGSEEIDNIIRIIRESSERNIRLIRDFVQQEFLESASVELFKRRVDVVWKIREIMEQYKAGEHHIQKNIEFTTSSDQIFLLLDDNKFMQVINNLFSNAIKFTPDNGTIALDLCEKEHAVLITIKDNGIGIPKQYHDTLFEKFPPARREGLRGEPSTGLGMSIIKTIVDWHKGRIWFESEENVGTTFFIELPKE